MDSPTDKSLQLSEVPTEIRDLILEQCLGDYWMIDEEAADLAFSRPDSRGKDPPTMQKYQTFDYCDSQLLNLLLVNHQLHNELKNAMGRSRSISYRGSGRFLTALTAPKFYDPGVVIIQFGRSVPLTAEYLPLLGARFRNLRDTYNRYTMD